MTLLSDEMADRSAQAEIFAERVRLALDRKRHPDGKRWTQKDLADAIGAQPNTINGWVNRGVLPPTPTRKAVAQALGVSLEWLDGETDDSTPHPEYAIPVVPGAAFPVRERFEPNPMYRRRLPPGAYELVYGYVRQLEELRVPRKSIEDAERILVDAAYHGLSDPRGRSEEEMMRAIRAAWGFVTELMNPPEAIPHTPIVDATSPVPRDGVTKSARKSSGSK